MSPKREIFFDFRLVHVRPPTYRLRTLCMGKRGDMRRSVLAAFTMAATAAGSLPEVSAVAGAMPSPNRLAAARRSNARSTRLLPSAGEKARIRVTGPKRYSRNVTGSTTLRHLVVGTYTVHASWTSVSHGARRYPTQPPLRRTSLPSVGLLSRWSTQTLCQRQRRRSRRAP